MIPDLGDMTRDARETGRAILFVCAAAYGYWAAVLFHRPIRKHYKRVKRWFRR